MNAYHIHIDGQVQGVGFRPFVWRLAKKHGVRGFVSNGKDGVHIEVGGKDDVCDKFYRAVIENAPRSARIIDHHKEPIPFGGWNGFEIRESLPPGTPSLLVTPDLAMCNACREEIFDIGNPRYHYAFTTCTHCGPRYSILRSIPFDRHHTSMDEFQMCRACLNEYHADEDRRFYSQTNSCHECGVRVSLKDSNGNDVANETESILALACHLLKQGRVIALKNLGGYLLLCDATNGGAVAVLRDRKHRPNKPFAVLYPDLETLRRDAEVSAFEAETLLGAEAPIVIVKARVNTIIAREIVAPDHPDIGVMLPYTPFMALLMAQIKIPLVATSGNVHGSPIGYNDADALSSLGQIADFFVVHNRQIVTAQDDSVVRFAGAQRIVLRRARGFAPTYFSASPCLSQHAALAMGSDLKSTLAFSNGANLYVSQYLGDLENYEVQQRYNLTLAHLSALFEIMPQVVLGDLHPAYFSSALGRSLAREMQVPFREVPHHEAHFCAVLAENNLLEAGEPVMGVVWDGTGWGPDGNVWGGEFFVFDGPGIQRTAHLDYFDHMLGDKFPLEPRLCALSLCKNNSRAKELLREKFTEVEWIFYNRVLSQPGTLKTSSIGRLFDGVASLLGLCDKSSYEGQAALYLEGLASAAHGGATPLSQKVRQRGFSVAALMEEIIVAMDAGTSREEIAFGFHVVLVQWIATVAHALEIRKLAFSGGVFQNAMLVRLIRENLGAEFQLYFHQQLSPNDECLSVGQHAWYYLDQKSYKKKSALSSLTLS